MTLHSESNESVKDLNSLNDDPKSIFGEFNKTDKIACVAHALVIT